MGTDLQTFDSLVADVRSIIDPIKSVTVASPVDHERAMLSGKKIKMLEKAIEDKRKLLVAPLNNEVKTINAYAAQIMEPLKGAESHLKKELIKWEGYLEAQRIEASKGLEAERKQKEAELAAKEKEQKALEELFGADDSFEAEQQCAKDEREKFLNEKALVDTQKQIEQARVKGTHKVWSFEVLDPNLVPRNFCTPVDALIRASVKSGVRDIPGVRIFEETKMTMRS